MSEHDTTEVECPSCGYVWDYGGEKKETPSGDVVAVATCPSYGDGEVGEDTGCGRKSLIIVEEAGD